ncbi:MAG: hypothetical protein J7494_11135 [Sphingobium sp.]|nr:hypothetical protein [Sphingobium sp.]
MREKLKSLALIGIVVLVAFGLGQVAPLLPLPHMQPSTNADAAALFLGMMSLLFALATTIMLATGRYPLAYLNADDPAKARWAGFLGVAGLAAFGLMLCWTALADPCNCTTHRTGPTISVAAALIYGATSYAMWRLYDEEMRAHVNRCMSVSMSLLLPLLILWAGLARSGLPVEFGPSGVLALAVASNYFGSFRSSGLRHRARSASKRDNRPDA